MNGLDLETFKLIQSLLAKGGETMGVFAIISLVLSALPALIQIVEMIINLAKGTGAGGIKKDVVMTVVQSILDGIASMPGNSTLKQQEPMILSIVSAAVDAIVAVFNKQGVFVKSA